MRRVLGWLPVALAVVGASGCGGHAEAGRPPEAPRAVAAPPAPSVATPADPLPALAELAARGGEIAPGMRILAQGEEAAPKRVEVPRVDGDVCVRALFVATTPVKATLQSSTGFTLAETSARAVSGVLGARGPVCVRRGQGLALRFEDSTPRVRYVLWGSPP